jgi:hypothetical protein
VSAPLPTPPSDPAGTLPRLSAVAVPKLWRLHWEVDLRRPRVHEPGRWRFDAPDGQYAVSYGNVSAEHAFVEVYGDLDDGFNEIAPSQADRRISSMTFSRKLRVVDLGDAALLRAIGADLRIATDTDYRVTQLWGERIHAWWAHADAIRFPGRKAGRRDNFCLFLDRCVDAIEQEGHGTLAENEELVLRACELFGLVPRLIFEAPSPHWL